MNHNKKVVLITGCSSGFGMTTAKYLSEKGYAVVPTVRNAADLGVLPNCEQLDVTWPQEKIDKVIAGVIKKYGQIGCLLNNAGYGYVGSVENASEEEVQKQMETNFLGTFKVIKSVIPEMKKKKTGLIVNVSSVLGLISIPDYGIYAASKFAIEGLSKALRLEMGKFNIKVAVINPGAFRTKFYANGVFEEKGSYDSSGYGKDPLEFAKLVERIIETDNLRSNYLIGDEASKIKLIRALPDFVSDLILKRYFS